MTNDDHPSHVDESFDWNTAYNGDVADYEPPNPVIMDVIAHLPAARALDVGCGAGGLMVALSQRGWQVTGIDVAKNAITAASAVIAEHGVNARLEVADARTWRPTGEFELITNSFALPFGVGERRKVYAMFRDALAPGGTVIIEDFDTSMARHGFLAGTDLVTVEELLEAFDGFEIVRAEVCETPAHDHGPHDGETHVEPWTAAILHARKPTK